MNIKDPHPTIPSNQGKDCAGVRSPGNITHRKADIKAENRSGQSLVPDVNHWLRCTGDEQEGVERVPHDGVDWGDVGVVGHQVGRGVLCGGKIDVTFICANQILIVLIRFECYCSGPIH